MAINEASLYANLHVETSPVQTTASWTDHIATVRDLSLSRGSEEPFIAISQTQPGSGMVSLVDNTATINPGYWVRIRYSSTVIWAGYVQDVTISYRVENGISYTVKTLLVLDWVAWIAQWTTSYLPAANRSYDRLVTLNNILPGTPITNPVPGGIPPISNTYDQLVGTRNIAEILDIMANSNTAAYWKANATAPTGSAATNDLIKWTATTPPSLNVAMTDGTHTGTPSNLIPYVDIELATQTSKVVNSVNIVNLYGINGEEKSTEYALSDSTSINTYGARFYEFETNNPVYNISPGYNATENLQEDPSYENTEYYLESTNWIRSNEQPGQDAGGAWSAKDGIWAMRQYNKTGSGTAITASDDKRIPVNPSTVYYLIGYGATTGTSAVRARTAIDWYNEAGVLISTSYGSFANVSSFKTWYQRTGSATSPATATSARIAIYFDRGGTSNFPATAKVWADGMYFGTTDPTDWFDGDTTDTSTFLYSWTGSQNSSTSIKSGNIAHNIATDFLTANKDPKYSPVTIRLNAQANLTAAQLLDLYGSAFVWFGGHRWTSVITSLVHNISINENGTTRWTIDVTVRPSTYTI